MKQNCAIADGISCITFYARIAMRRYLRTYGYVFSNGTQLMSGKIFHYQRF